MKKVISILIIIFLFIIVLFTFYNINEKNYIKYKAINRHTIDHPENLPTKNLALNTSFWFKSIIADLYWLQTIQYIWSNAVSSEYKKFLFIIIDLITELNPYFEHPYSIWQLLIPEYNFRYEDINSLEQKKYQDQAIELWLKWIKNFCDLKKIKLINDEDNLYKIWTEEQFKNPCSHYKIPYYLAYVYYFYKKDPLEAAKYYKVTSAIKNWLEWSKVMAAIMSWKWWDREKSYFMFLNIAQFIESENQVCLEFASYLQQIWVNIFIDKKIKLDSKIIKILEQTKIKFFWKENNSKDNILKTTECINYVNKSLRELNLEYITRANYLYKQKKWKNSKHAKQLFDEWYINYLPTDYQQHKNYWIIYEYNKETWNYDYINWIYE